FFSLAFQHLLMPLGEATLVNKHFYFKNSMLIGMLYFFRRKTVNTEERKGMWYNFMLELAMAAFALNIVEKILGVHFQSFTGYAAFTYAINGMEPSGNYGLAWTFETQTTAKRFASFFSDPLELASSCLLGFSAGLIWYL